MNKQRMEAEQLVYRVMDKLDPSEKNKEFWMAEFSKMSDDQFNQLSQMARMAQSFIGK